MLGRDCELSELERMKQGAPRDPGPIAAGLQGWTRGDALAVCAPCAGRIMGRGMGDAFKGWAPVFKPEPFPGCDLPSCTDPLVWGCERPGESPQSYGDLVKGLE